MGNIFSGSEIVTIGIQIEKNGRDFYNALFEKPVSPKAGEVFRLLAKEEEKHITVFEKILSQLEQYQPPEAYPGEYFAYMKALSGEHIFTRENQGALAAKQIAGEREAIAAGIGFEKDSIIFYEGIKKVVPEFDLKIIEELIAQEQKHLRILVDLKKNY